MPQKIETSSCRDLQIARLIVQIILSPLFLFVFFFDSSNIVACFFNKWCRHEFSTERTR
jgi:hypothetical protein